MKKIKTTGWVFKFSDKSFMATNMFDVARQWMERGYNPEKTKRAITIAPIRKKKAK